MQISMQLLKKILLASILVTLLGLSSCSPDPVPAIDESYTLIKPSHFPLPVIPTDNPLTVTKIRLGRMLFYDKMLSDDQSVSCASCHKQENAFASNNRLDMKVHGGMTTRNGMPLFNMVFTPKFFWDNRTSTIEATCLDALKGEQDFKISFVKDRLFNKPNYKAYFQLAFGTDNPTEDMVTKALASFIRTMVSASSPVDQGIKEGNINKYLSPLASEGRIIYSTEEGDCFHCHGDAQGAPLMTDNIAHNNGLDSFNSWALFRDPGLGFVTGAQSDYGKFRTPSTRNLRYTAPYMHDGRIATIAGVLNHYNNGVKQNVNLDPNMKHPGGLRLTPDRIERLQAFLDALNDEKFITDTAFSDPFK